MINYIDLVAAREAYSRGENVMAFLRRQLGVNSNTSEVIEFAYDLQAGSYIEYLERNFEEVNLYATEVASMLEPHLKPHGSLLDVGTGELTTLSLVLSALQTVPSKVLAFDLSWSRIHLGLKYAQKKLPSSHQRIFPFVANMNSIPLADKSIDVTTSSHALEPNGKQLTHIVSELFRVTREVLILFEPSYELNSDLGKRRMEDLGYIYDLEHVVRTLGGKVIDSKRLSNIDNPLNPTVCFVITPSDKMTSPTSPIEKSFLTIPGTNFSLIKVGDNYWSKQTGQCFPILKQVPILRSECAFFATALEEKYLDDL
jgi:hypothetical protein